MKLTAFASSFFVVIACCTTAASAQQEAIDCVEATAALFGKRQCFDAVKDLAEITSFSNTPINTSQELFRTVCSEMCIEDSYRRFVACNDTSLSELITRGCSKSSSFYCYDAIIDQSLARDVILQCPGTEADMANCPQGCEAALDAFFEIDCCVDTVYNSSADGFLQFQEIGVADNNLWVNCGRDPELVESCPLPVTTEHAAVPTTDQETTSPITATNPTSKASGLSVKYAILSLSFMLTYFFY